MSPPTFDNILNKFKSSTKQAADQMGRAAKIAKLKMDIMTLAGEKTRHFQTIGERTHTLFTESSTLDGSVLRDRVQSEFKEIELIEARIRELENQIADLQAVVQHADVSDVAEATNVKDLTEPGESSENSGSSGT